MKLILLLLTVLCITSCNDESRNLQLALSTSDGNRAQLEKVLNHYPRNSQRQRAARYLIANMLQHHSIGSPNITRFSDSLHTHRDMPHRKMSSYQDKLWVKIKNEKEISPEYTMDINSISAGYLIENIEQAFEAWETAPWHKEISFDMFCTYILPYRLLNEPLTHWREPLRKKYLPYIAGITDPKRAYEIVYSKIRKDWNLKPASYPYNRDPLILDIAMKGECASRTVYVVFVMRALGIPAAYDYCKIWANYGNSGHTWAAYIAGDGETFTVVAPDTLAFSYGRIPGIETEPIRHTNYDTLLYQADSVKRMAKVFRKSFAPQQDRSFSDEEEIPYLARDIQCTDVTEQYCPNPQKLKIKVKDFDNLYLCTFNAKRKGWVPFVPMKKEARYAVCGKLYPGIVYMPAYYIDEEVIPVGHPIMLAEEGQKEIKPIQDKTTDVTLRRKYLILGHWINRWALAEGAQFELSDRKEFDRPEAIETIHTITHVPIGTQRVNTSPSRAYRYIRFKPAEGKIPAMSGLAFYKRNDEGTLQKLSGEHYGHRVKERAIRPLFDGKTSTSLYLKNEYWVGYDLGKGNTDRVEHISYSMRSDANEIEAGHEYELKYYDNGWQSLGVQTATSDTLVYRDVPAGALLWLSDLTKGIEERIFIYKDGKQIFY